MNIDEMTEGREMDALIAEKIFGLKVEWEIEYLGEQIPSSKQLADKYDENGILPLYSTDIAAAWEVVEKLSDDFGLIINIGIALPGLGVRYYCDVVGNSMVYEDSMPLAICRAALKALSPAPPPSHPLSHE